MNSTTHSNTANKSHNGHGADPFRAGPPQADNAEVAVISCLMLDPGRYGDVARIIGAEDFRQDLLRQVFVAIRGVIEDGAFPDERLIFQRLSSVPPPNGVSWVAHLSDIHEHLPHAGNVMRFAEAVRAASNRRRARRVLLTAAAAVESGEGDIAELLTETAGKLDTIASTKTNYTGDIIGIKLSTIEAQEINWLWPGRIALGKQTMLIGDPGVGKSFMSIDLAARITKGYRWPDCNSTAPVGSVILLADEDDPASTIRPRFEAAGGNLDKVEIIKATRNPERAVAERWIDLTKDMAAIEVVAARMGDCRMIVIDPITAYLGKTRSHDNAEVRGVLGPLGEMAARLNAAVLLINHLRKGEGDAMSRSLGSIGFVASSRAVFAVVKDRMDPSGKNRLFLPVKNNLGNDTTGLSFALTSSMYGGPQPCVAWGAEPVTTTADEAMATQVGRRPESRNKAAEYLVQALADGPRQSRELEDEADQHGISQTTLKRARRELNVVAYRDPPGKGPWYWRLPDSPKAEGQKPEGQNPDTDILAFWPSA